MNENVEGDSLVISSETEMSTNEQKTKPTEKKGRITHHRPKSHNQFKQPQPPNTIREQKKNQIPKLCPLIWFDCCFDATTTRSFYRNPKIFPFFSIIYE